MDPNPFDLVVSLLASAIDANENGLDDDPNVGMVVPVPKIISSFLDSAGGVAYVSIVLLVEGGGDAKFNTIPPNPLVCPNTGPDNGFESADVLGDAKGSAPIVVFEAGVPIFDAADANGDDSFDPTDDVTNNEEGARLPNNIV